MGMLGVIQHLLQTRRLCNPFGRLESIFCYREVHINYSLIYIYKVGRHLVALYCSRKLVLDRGYLSINKVNTIILYGLHECSFVCMWCGERCIF